MRLKSIIIILFSCMLLLLLIGCPKISKTGNKPEPEREYRPDWILSDEENATMRQMAQRRYASGEDNFGDHSQGIGNELGSTSDAEVAKLRELVEIIRKDCLFSVNKCEEMLENLSDSSSQKLFYEERARILAKYDVCSQILARIEERGIY